MRYSGLVGPAGAQPVDETREEIVLGSHFDGVRGGRMPVLGRSRGFIRKRHDHCLKNLISALKFWQWRQIDQLVGFLIPI